MIKLINSYECTLIELPTCVRGYARRQNRLDGGLALLRLHRFRREPVSFRQGVAGHWCRQRSKLYATQGRIDLMASHSAAREAAENIYAH